MTSQPKKLVIDTSVAVKWLTVDGEADIEQADALLSQAEQGSVELYAPELSKYEIGNALWKKKLDTREAKGSLATYYYLPIHFISESKEKAVRTYQIAHEFGMTYYDASFISLAEELDNIVVTANPKHQQRAKSVTVISLTDYLDAI